MTEDDDGFRAVIHPALYERLKAEGRDMRYFVRQALPPETQRRSVTLTAETANRTMGRIKGLEEAKEVVRRDVRDKDLLQVLTVDLDIRIRELKRSLG